MLLLSYSQKPRNNGKQKIRGTLAAEEENNDRV